VRLLTTLHGSKWLMAEPLEPCQIALSNRLSRTPGAEVCTEGANGSPLRP